MNLSNNVQLKNVNIKAVLVRKCIVLMKIMANNLQLRNYFRLGIHCH